MTFDLDVYIKLQSENNLTVIDIKGFEEFHQAILYFVLGLLVICLQFVRQMSGFLAWMDEPVSWGLISIEWSCVYVKELAKLIWEKLLTIIKSLT